MPTTIGRIVRAMPVIGDVAKALDAAGVQETTKASEKARLKEKEQKMIEKHETAMKLQKKAKTALEKLRDTVEAKKAAGKETMPDYTPRPKKIETPIVVTDSAGTSVLSGTVTGLGKVGKLVTAAAEQITPDELQATVEAIKKQSTLSATKKQSDDLKAKVETEKEVSQLPHINLGAGSSVATDTETYTSDFAGQQETQFAGITTTGSVVNDFLSQLTPMKVIGGIIISVIIWILVKRKR